AVGTLDLDRAAEGGHDGSTDRQPQTRPAAISCPCRIYPVEPLEDVRQMFWRNADASVGNSNRPTAIVDPAGHRDPSGRPGVFDGIVEQVVKDATQLPSIADKAAGRIAD